MNVLVTGGAGHIGSITCVQLIGAGSRPVILDNLADASAAVIDRTEQVAGARSLLVRGDVRDRALMERVLDDQSIDAVVHFPELKAVAESAAKPMEYADNNVLGTLGVPNNLMPFVAQVAVRRREKLRIFGDDHPTPEGTWMRDYIHVTDLPHRHLATFGRASDRDLPFEFAPPRAGDATTSRPGPAQAQKVLRWSATRDLDEMCADTWRWQSRNPDGHVT